MNKEREKQKRKRERNEARREKERKTKCEKGHTRLLEGCERNTVFQKCETKIVI